MRSELDPSHQSAANKFAILTSSGKVKSSRHVEFDESAPPACDTRTDFAPFMSTQPEVPHPVQPTRTVQPASLPDMSPLPTIQEEHDEEPASDAPENAVSAPSFNVNPLFEPEHEDREDDQHTSPPTILSPSAIPPPPALKRTSERSNKGIPPNRYGKFATGLPGMRKQAHVSFRH
jgi:hypothetical protein